VLDQVLKQVECPLVGGIGLRGCDETSGSFPVLALAIQGDAEIFEGVGRAASILIASRQ